MEKKCKCGHSKKEHIPYCIGECGKDKEGRAYGCDCYIFKEDNSQENTSTRVLSSSSEEITRQTSSPDTLQDRKGCGEEYRVEELEGSFKCGTSEESEFRWEGVGVPLGTSYAIGYCPECQSQDKGEKDGERRNN